MLTIIEISNADTFYLNHSCMSSLSFGSEEMAWTTDDREKAELMLDKVKTRKAGSESVFEISSL